MPADKMAAFHGWLKKDDGNESSGGPSVLSMWKVNPSSNREAGIR